jgi:hypothetical protein
MDRDAPDGVVRRMPMTRQLRAAVAALAAILLLASQAFALAETDPVEDILRG